MKKYLAFVLASLVLSACTSSAPPAMSSSQALAQLDRLEQLDEREYQKARVRDEERYQTARSRYQDHLKDEKVALQNERIHYQNQAIQYQNSRQATKDVIDDYGRILMHKANAENKANENLSKQKKVIVNQRGVFF